MSAFALSNIFAPYHAEGKQPPQDQSVCRCESFYNHLFNITFNIKFQRRNNRLFFLSRGRSDHKFLLDQLSHGSLMPLYGTSGKYKMRHLSLRPRLQFKRASESPMRCEPQ